MGTLPDSRSRSATQSELIKLSTTTGTERIEMMSRQERLIFFERLCELRAMYRRRGHYDRWPCISVVAALSAAGVLADRETSQAASAPAL